MPRALALLNPKSRNGGSLIAEAEGLLQARGFELISAGDCDALKYPSLVIRHRDEIDLVIVGGGDGSVKCAAEGALRTGIPLGILPLGTANNFARSLGIPETLEEAVNVMVEGHRAEVDLGLVNGEFFVSVAGIGLSTQVHKTTPPSLKRRFGPLAYAVKALQWIRRTDGFRVEIWDGKQRIRSRALQVTICNGKYFGGRLKVRDDATLEDRKLDMMMIPASRPFRGLFSAVRAREEHTRRISSPVLEIRTWPRMEIDVEGAVVTRTPALFEVVPEAIEVLVPRVSQQSGAA